MEKMRSYSVLFIIDPSKEDVMDSVKNDIRTVVTENSGSVVEEKVMGKKALAYPIRKKPEGIYYEIVMNAVPATMEKVTKQFQIRPEIMRTMISSASK
jgi:small subunit ribosomal protein S6